MALNFHIEAEDDQSANKSLPTVGTHIKKSDAQEIALRVALRGVGNVAPNPLVGAVIVDKEHNFLAAGGHLRIGGPHAEIEAIRQATSQLPGIDFSTCTLYVTLEPCAHAGRTPACTDMIIAKKFRKVVYGLRDPNPKVTGAGANLLKSSGIETEFDSEWSNACARRTEFFLWNIETKTPFVGLKAAISLDGAIARRGDKRTWITGERARAFGHFLRIKYDAIVVGTQTLLDDNPSLTPRDAVIAGRTPWRVVVDPNGKGLLAHDKIPVNLLDRSCDNVIWIIGENAAEGLKNYIEKHSHIKIIKLKQNSLGIIEPKQILHALSQHDITSVLLEGGAGLYRPFIENQLVNRYHLFQSARILGGKSKVNFFDGKAGSFDMTPNNIDITPLGQDWLTEFNGRRQH